MSARVLLLLLAAEGLANAAYNYFWVAVPGIAQTNLFQRNGNLTDPLTPIAPGYAGSMIWKQAMTDGTQDHEVYAGANWGASSGPQRLVQYVRASLDACYECNIGSFYAAVLQRANSNSPFTLTVYKRQNNVLTQLYYSELGTTTPPTLRTVIRTTGSGANWGLTVMCGNIHWWTPETSLTTGQPGAGVSGASGININLFRLGLADHTPPGAVTNLSVGGYSTYAQLQWNAATDDANGVGVQGYGIWRNGAWIGHASGTMTFQDNAVSPNTTYTYSVAAMDYHANLGPPTQTTVTTDPLPYSTRRTGVEPKGAYWGAMGEQIDMLSGNLNFTIPLLKAVGRGSWSAGFALSYNSQNWEYVNGTTIKHGADVGYGFGWRLMAGSIIPVYDGPTVSYYLFTDATGAEYRLDARDGNVWWGVSGLQTYYDEYLHRLYFNDGSFWVMDCVTAGNEQDAGTRYPTLMQDSNGNQVRLLYHPAVGSGTPNTSARLKEIEDVRAVQTNWSGSWNYRTFQFTYNTDAIPHLIEITNNIGTSENIS